MRTLETGLGISTVLFAGWGCEHTCVVPSQNEATRLSSYLAQRDIPTGRLEIRVGSSDIELPRLDGLLDLAFIDGAHAFPLPTIDWYYAGQRLRRGGLLVLDDVDLPALTRGLLPFLDSDRRWRMVRSSSKWRAYERYAEGPLLESWDAQWFFFPLARRVRRQAGRVKRRILMSHRPNRAGRGPVRRVRSLVDWVRPRKSRCSFT